MVTAPGSHQRRRTGQESEPESRVALFEVFDLRDDVSELVTFLGKCVADGRRRR